MCLFSMLFAVSRYSSFFFYSRGLSKINCFAKSRMLTEPTKRR